MTKPTSKVKDRWNQAHYDRIYLRVKKGEKEELERIAKLQDKSLNAWITEAIEAKKRED